MTLAAGALVAGTSSRLAAQELSSKLQLALNRWYLSAARQAPGRWGIAVADQRGEILWGVKPSVALVPASTVKLFTTGFARSVLGGQARKHTRVVGAGEVNPFTGDWDGSWAIELNGDPTLERASGQGPRLYDLAVQLAYQGIRHVYGPLVVTSADGPAYARYPDAWSPGNRGSMYAPLVGPLAVHENTVQFSVGPGRKLRAKAEVVAESPQGIAARVRIEATTVAGRRQRLILRSDPGGGWVIAGHIGSGAPARVFSVAAPDPKAILELTWMAALDQAGIEWLPGESTRSAPVGAQQRVLAEVVSPSLDSLVSEVNRRSYNLGAELLLQWAAGAEGAPMLADHVRSITGSDDGLRLVDGSGMSSLDRAAPATFIDYLARFPTTPAGRNFPFLLPANGDGTLHNLRSGQLSEGVVRAKTGTLSRASTVSGYLGRTDGILLVSVMYNGRRTHVARRAQLQLFKLLGAQGVMIPIDSTNVDDQDEPGEQLGGDSLGVGGGARLGAPVD